MTQNPFLGTWKLVSCELRAEDGRISYPYGQEAVGYIMYTDDGYMSVGIMSPNRPKFAVGEMKRGTQAEQAAAVDTYVSYGGRYDIQGDTVVHHLDVSLFPNWIGIDQTRFFKFDDDTLSLRTPPFLFDGVQQTAYLIWKHV